jgi:N-acetylglutamate synthase-like GNAT family acetyltransferase
MLEGGIRMSYVIRLATENDLLPIVQLIQKGKLNTAGIEQAIQHFLVVENEESGELIGTAGLEVVAGGVGLLRSLLLTPQAPAKLGMDLIHILLYMAAEKGIAHIYLVTRTAPAFFQGYGFSSVRWRDVPQSVRESAHFKQQESTGAAVMVYKTKLLQQAQEQ